MHCRKDSANREQNKTNSFVFVPSTVYLKKDYGFITRHDADKVVINLEFFYMTLTLGKMLSKHSSQRMPNAKLNVQHIQ